MLPLLPPPVSPPTHEPLLPTHQNHTLDIVSDAGQKVGYITLSTMPLDELDESMGFQL